MLTIVVGILTFMSMINFMLSSVEHGKSFITLRPGSTFPTVQQILELSPSKIVILNLKTLKAWYSFFVGKLRSDYGIFTMFMINSCIVIEVA